MENMVLIDGEGKGVWLQRPNCPPTLCTVPPPPPKVGDPPSAVALQVSFQSWLKHSKTKSPGRRPFVDYQGVGVWGNRLGLRAQNEQLPAASKYIHTYSACNMYV